MNSALYETINRLNNEEIIKRLQQKYYTEEAKTIALHILDERNNVDPIAKEKFIESIPFYKRHPIWTFTVVGAITTALGRAIKNLIQS